MKLMMDLGRERKSPNQQVPVLKSLKVSGRLKLISLEGFRFYELKIAGLHTQHTQQYQTSSCCSLLPIKKNKKKFPDR
jgi:hypothetical protein